MEYEVEGRRVMERKEGKKGEEVIFLGRGKGDIPVDIMRPLQACCFSLSCSPGPEKQFWRRPQLASIFYILTFVYFLTLCCMYVCILPMCKCCGGVYVYM